MQELLDAATAQLLLVSGCSCALCCGHMLMACTTGPDVMARLPLNAATRTHGSCCTCASQHCAEYADSKGEVLLTAQQGALQLGLWVNTQRNPRFKVSLQCHSQCSTARCTQTCTACLHGCRGGRSLRLMV
jgi:hypothetical protein